MDEKFFTVLLVCFGDYAHYSCRAIESLLRTPGLQSIYDVHVGCNVCGSETLRVVRDNLQRRLITSAIISDRNLNKSPMMRQLLGRVETPYVLVMDDDSYVEPGWAEALVRFLRQEDPGDVAGKLSLVDRTPEYQRIAERRPWWRGEQHIPEDQRRQIRMCLGAFYLAKTEFLRQHDFPDAGMVMQFEDVLLADLVHHVGGRIRQMPADVLARVVINAGERRWQWEDGRNDRKLADGPPAVINTPAVVAGTTEALRQAVEHLEAGRVPQAEAILQQVLVQCPRQAQALHLLGMIASRTGRKAWSLELMQQSIEAQPDVSEFHNNVGSTLAEMGRIQEAAEAFRQAIQLKPVHAQAHNNLGNALGKLGQPEEAIGCYAKALELRPRFVEAHYNLGNALRRMGRFPEAIASYQRAIQLWPDDERSNTGLALALHENGRSQEAEAVLERTLANRPDHAPARLSRAMLLLARSDWARGWAEYEWRWKMADAEAGPARFRQPVWDGSDLAGRTILLHSEQGLGTTIQFARYAAVLADSGARVILECQPPLKALLRSMNDAVQVIERGEELPAFDVQVPLLSLPRILATTPSTVPGRIPYLRAEPDRAERWQAEIRKGTGPRIGIAWQGNPAYAGDRQRSISLACFASLADVAGARLWSLQKGAGSEQLCQSDAPHGVVDLGPRLDTGADAFLDTAAAMLSLDLIITSDTSIAHLAGALGVPVWLALCYVPDWRWMLAGDTTPWYPSMRLFRQQRPGDWTDVFKRIAGALLRGYGATGPTG